MIDPGGLRKICNGPSGAVSGRLLPSIAVYQRLPLPGHREVQIVTLVIFRGIQILTFGHSVRHSQNFPAGFHRLLASDVVHYDKCGVRSSSIVNLSRVSTLPQQVELTMSSKLSPSNQPWKGATVLKRSYHTSCLSSPMITLLLAVLLGAATNSASASTSPYFQPNSTGIRLQNGFERVLIQVSCSRP